MAESRNQSMQSASHIYGVENPKKGLQIAGLFPFLRIDIKEYLL